MGGGVFCVAQGTMVLKSRLLSLVCRMLVAISRIGFIDWSGFGMEEMSNDVGMTLDMSNFALGLLANDFFFFQDGDIVCKGAGHEIEGIQINAAKVDQMMTFINERIEGFESIQEAGQYVCGYLGELGKDDALRVPADRISDSIGRALPGGYLSGIALANLCSCNRALVVDSGKTDSGDTYRVIYDTRLALGIPSFFDLCARMIWDLRQSCFSTQGVPFFVCFQGARSFDNSYFDDVAVPVLGAQVDPGVLLITESPKIDIGDGAFEGAPADDEGDLKELLDFANSSDDPFLSKIVGQIGRVSD